MSEKATILVVSASVADAELVRDLLSGEFGAVAISTDPDRAVEDFEKFRPDVLVLAFKALLNAERYYLGLYRLSKKIDSIRHRTLILCSRNDVNRVYEHCRKGLYDDYILFWPTPHDTLQLPLAVHHALGQIDSNREPSAAEIAVQAGPLQALEPILEKYTNASMQCVETAADSMHQAQAGLLEALDRFQAKFTSRDSIGQAQVNDPAGFEKEISRLKNEEIGKNFVSVDASIQSMQQCVSTLGEEVAPQLKSIRSLNALASQVRPMILVVDDDLFQHKLLSKMLENVNAEQIFVSSGTEALRVLRQRRPDLILMDINLSDSDGIDLTRRIKAVDRLANIPVIMITGHGEKQVVMDSVEAGADDFVVKPVDKDILLAKLHKFVGI
jgi:CheY-like chemotaxis protein